VIQYFDKLSLETKGIIFMILSQFFFATNDAFIKHVLAFYNNDTSYLGEIVFIRGLFVIFFIGLILFIKKKLDLKFLLTSKHLLIRGGMEGVCAIFFFLGLATLPFADLYVLLNLAPIIITASGAILLKEKVGWRRWSAVLMGFAGVVIVINPTKLEFGFAFVFPLLAAAFITLRDTYTKKFEQRYDSIQIAFVTGFMVTVVFGIYMLFHFKGIKLDDILFIFVSAILLSFGYIFAVATVKIATISLTSTFRYTVIIWGIVYGYLFFNEIPSHNMIIGCIVVVLSGLFIIHRQKKIGIID
jgi:drug/metabolite transporter (DMT)-like permease